MPLLALDRIWITNEGRAKLLDFPAPGIDAGGGAKGSVTQTEALPTPVGSYEAQLFLKQAAASAVEGRTVPIEEVRERPVAAVLPLHARTFLNEMPNFPSLAQLQQNADYSAAADVIKQVHVRNGMLSVVFEWSDAAAGQIKATLIGGIPFSLFHIATNVAMFAVVGAPLVVVFARYRERLSS